MPISSFFFGARELLVLVFWLLCGPTRGKKRKTKNARCVLEPLFYLRRYKKYHTHFVQRMGVEGAPEGPEDPIAQICVTLGTVRVFRFSKHTRDTRQKRMLFFFPFIVLEVFSSIVVVQKTQPPRRRRSLGDSSCALLLVYSLYLSLSLYHSVFVSLRTRRCASISDFSLLSL